MSRETRPTNHSIVSALLIGGTVLSSVATFGRALLAEDESMRFNYALITVISLWTGVVLWLRHRRWVRSQIGPAGAPNAPRDET